jgi:hypothetical protein
MIQVNAKIEINLMLEPSIVKIQQLAIGSCKYCRDIIFIKLSIFFCEFAFSIDLILLLNGRPLS